MTPPEETGEPEGNKAEGHSVVIDGMKVDELKGELDRLRIEYPAAAKKPELIELLKESE